MGIDKDDTFTGFYTIRTSYERILFYTEDIFVGEAELHERFIELHRYKLISSIYRLMDSSTMGFFGISC